MLWPYCSKCLFFVALPFSCTSAALVLVAAFLWKRNVSDEEKEIGKSRKSFTYEMWASSLHVPGC